MISYIKDDITNVTSGLVVHGTNCRGAFGSGVAGAVRRKWPEVYTAFKNSPDGTGMLGNFIPVKITDDLVVANCYTQDYFGSDGKRYASPEAIKTALTKACLYVLENGISTISLPKIGAGLGGLSWEKDVVQIIVDLNQQFQSITFNVYYID